MSKIDEGSFLASVSGIEPKPQTEGGYGGSMSTFILKVLIADLKEIVKKRIDRLQNIGVDETPPFQSFLQLDKDNTAKTIFTTLSEITKPPLQILSPIIRTLILWRNSHVNSATSDASVVPASGSILSTLSLKSTTKKTSPAIFSDERYHLAIDYVFCTFVLFLLQNLNKHNLEDTLAPQLEFLALDHFKPRVVERRSGATEENRKLISEQYSTIIGILSKYRFKHISIAFNKEMSASGLLTSSASEGRAKALIQGIRFLQLKIKTKHSLEFTLEFLNNYFNLIKTTTRSEVKTTLQETLQQLLRPLLDANLYNWENLFRPNTDYSAWFMLIRKIYESTEPKKKKKSAELLQIAPLMVVSLCLSDKDHFLANHGFVLELMIGRVNRLKMVGLDLIRLLLEVYLSRCTEPSDAPQVMEHLQFLNTQLFTQKKPILAMDCIDGFVDIIVVISKSHIDFACKNIIFELLRGDITVPERTAVGLKAFLAWNEKKNILPKSKKVRRISQTFSKTSMEPYLGSFDLFLSQILTSLDTHFGNLTMQNASKTLAEHLTRISLGSSGLELLKIALNCLPLCYPVKIPPTDFVTMMARYAIHLDENIREAASEAMKRMQSSHPELRLLTFNSLITLTLSISDRNSSIIAVLLTQILQLLLKWGELLKENQTTHNMQNSEFLTLVHKLESLSIVFLCSFDPKIRNTCMGILQAIRRLDHLSTSAESINSKTAIISVRLMDIIEESNTDIMNRLRNSKTRTMVETSTSVMELAATSKKEANWTYCLGELANLFIELCTDPTKMACDLIGQRIVAVQPEEGKEVKDPEFNSLWRNYVVVASAVVSPSDHSTTEEGKKTFSAAEFFSMVVPFLKSNVDEYRHTVIAALERVSVTVCHSLLEELKPLRADTVSKRRLKRKDKMRLRNVISLIYSNIVENIKPGNLVKDEILRNNFVEYVQETIQYLNEEVGEEFFLWDTYQYVRYNLCSVIKGIAQELQYTQVFDRNLRKDLFMTLKCWTKGEDMLKDEQTRKKFNAYLVKFSKEHETRNEKMFAEHAIILQQASCSAMATLLLGPAWDSLTDVNSPTSQWINSLLLSNSDKLRRIGRTALQCYLKGNIGNVDFVKVVVDQCYSPTIAVSKGYFLSLVDLCKERKVICPLPIMVNLILHKSGDRAASIRRNAIQLMELTDMSTTEAQKSMTDDEDDDLTEYDEDRSPLAVDSTLQETYLRSQCVLSKKLSDELPDICYDLFADLASRITRLDQASQRQMLSYAIPWIEKMKFDNRSFILKVFDHFITLTLKFSEAHSVHIEKLWTTLAEKDENIPPLVRSLLEMGLVQQNTGFVPLAKKVAQFLGRSSAAVTVNALVHELSSFNSDSTSQLEKQEVEGANAGVTTISRESSKNSLGIPIPSDNSPGISGNSTLNGSPLIAPAVLTGSPTFKSHLEIQHENALRASRSDVSESTTWDIGSLPTEASTWTIARGHLALIILAEISYEIGKEFIPHLPLILQLVFLGFDSPMQPLQEHTRILLLNLIKSLVTQPSPGNQDEKKILIWKQRQELEEYLRSKEGRPLWPNEILAMNHPVIESAKDLANLVSKVSYVLSSSAPDLNERWANEALTWAVSCPYSQLVGRAYQIFRALRKVRDPVPPPLTRDATIHVMRALNRSLSSVSQHQTHSGNREEILHWQTEWGLALEILSTLEVMVEGLDEQKLILFTQLFWGAVGLLYSDFALHFAEAAKLLSKLISRLDFSDKSVQNVIRASTPQWEGIFVGVQPLVLRGLLASSTEAITIKLLSQLTTLPCDEVFHPQPAPLRYLANLLGLLPYLCNRLKSESAEAVTEANRICLNLVQASTKDPQLGKIGKILSKYASQSYADANAFLCDLKKPLRDLISPKYLYYTFSFLFHMLGNAVAVHYYGPVLQIIHHVMSVTMEQCLDNVTIRNKIPEWFNTIIKFLEGPHYHDAIQVVNICIKNTEMSLQIPDWTRSNLTDLVRIEFSNVPNSVGNIRAVFCLEKVLESCKYSDKSKVINHDISPSFWNKFFSSDVVGPYNSYNRLQSLSADEDLTETEEEIEETDERERERRVEYQMSRMYDDEDLPIALDPKKDHGSPGDKRFKFDAQPKQFAQFPTFEGFDDLLDFGDAEAISDDEEEEDEKS
eukprot:TRINITY_DN6840_c0_g2_i1.p1 TRINITY_DN6840_c0_g2~~TRINITY_DN6840_c0_g2_i1.p1  ORF type:complete len:2140 (+),score=665.08 TRINITY_DN6840_c0_g2_i1:103-6522(+)